MGESLLEQQLRIFEAIKDISIIPELRHKPTSRYRVGSVEDVLFPIIAGNDVIIVSGSYFGDEGKGKITDAIANHPDIYMVVRDNSGNNAGHTVYHDGLKYVFHLVPSGILIPGKICAIGPECVLDPLDLMEDEISQLVNTNVEYKEKLFVGNTHIVGPHHKVMDFALSPSNSSTLKGMSYVHASKVRKKGLRLDHIFNSKTTQASVLEKDLEVYHAMLEHRGLDESKIYEEMEEFSKKRHIPDNVFEFLKAKDKVGFIIDLYEKEVKNNDAFPQRADVTRMMQKAVAEKKKVLLESPQSFWLSNATEKHWASSTSAHTHATGVLASSGLNASRIRYAVINVAKTPADSRVGIGANPSSFVPQDYFSKKGIRTLDDLGNACVDFDKIQKMFYGAIQPNGILKPTAYTDDTGTYSISEAMAIACSRHFGEKGATTGKPRITGLYDCMAGSEVNTWQGPYLSISALDRGDSLDNVGMTVGYVYFNPSGEEIDSNGKVYKNNDIIRIGDQYPCDNVLKFCHPIIKVMPGWNDSPVSAKLGDVDTLSNEISDFVSNLSDLTGFIPIGFGNGQDTKDMVYIKKE